MLWNIHLHYPRGYEMHKLNFDTGLREPVCQHTFRGVLKESADPACKAVLTDGQDGQTLCLIHRDALGPSGQQIQKLEVGLQHWAMT